MAKTIFNVIILILSIISESTLLKGINCQTYSGHIKQEISNACAKNFHTKSDQQLKYAHGEKSLSSSINKNDESLLNDFKENTPEGQKLKELPELSNSKEENQEKSFLSVKKKKNLKQPCWIGEDEANNCYKILKGEEITLRAMNSLN